MHPLKPPPPPGSPWAAIEAARLRLGWNPRQLSVEAMGESNHSHYNAQPKRGWGGKHTTIAKYVAALQRAGVPLEELESRPPIQLNDPAAGEVLRYVLREQADVDIRIAVREINNVLAYERSRADERPASDPKAMAGTVLYLLSDKEGPEPPESMGLEFAGGPK